MVAVLGLAVRFAFIFLMTPGKSVGPRDDDGDYHHIAESMVQQHTYANANGYRAWRPPLFPLFLSGIFELHGVDNFLAVRLYLAILSLVIPFSIYFLTLQFWDERTALIAYIWGMFHAPFVYYACHVQNDTLFLVISTWSLIFLILQRNARDIAVSGLLAGFACLGRSQFAGAFLIGTLWTFLSTRPRFRNTALFVGCFVLVMSPWWIRNYRLFHRFVPTSTEGGYTLWIGNNDETDGGGVSPSKTIAPYTMDEIERDRLHYKTALTYIRENPKRTLRLAIAKEKHFWSLVPHVGGRGIKAIALIANIPMFLLALIGIVMWRNRLKPWAPFFALCAYYTVIQTLFPGIMRYRLVLEPFFISIAAATLTALCTTEKSPRSPL